LYASQLCARCFELICTDRVAAASQDLDCWGVYDKRFWEWMDTGSKWRWILHYRFTDFSIPTVLLG
jgi:hypothetical protein